MCTAVSDGGFFGRTLDVESVFGEKVILAPRNFQINFKYSNTTRGYAILGIGCIRDGVPLYYDAVNESGLCVAALNFPESAVYFKPNGEKKNIASFELISLILRTCKNTAEAQGFLLDANITDDAFSAELPPAPLHWLIADGERAFCVESGEDGLKIYENKYGVLTNEPPFDKQCEIFENQDLYDDSFAWDFSSSFRFCRTVYVKENTVHERGELSEVERFFHVMDTVSVPKGCVRRNGVSRYTVYISCADRNNFSYFFTTYDNRNIQKISGKTHYLDGKSLAVFDVY